MTGYQKVCAKDITIDPLRWQWNVRRGGLWVQGRVDMADGRIKLLLGDGSDMIVQPKDKVWARRTEWVLNI